MFTSSAKLSASEYENPREKEREKKRARGSTVDREGCKDILRERESVMRLDERWWAEVLECVDRMRQCMYALPARLRVRGLVE